MLSGSLESVSLPGLLQLLSAERRSGCLSLAAGQVWLDPGGIVHATCGASSGEAAVFALVETATGDFSFEEGGELPPRSVTTPTEHLVLEAACRRDHRRRAEDGFVAPTAIPAFAAVAGGAATPRFDTLQWKVLASIDGRKTIEQLSSELRLPLPALTGVIAALIRVGALELGTGS